MEDGYTFSAASDYTSDKIVHIDLKSDLRTIFSENNISLPHDVLSKLIEYIEEVVDLTTNSIIQDYNKHLEETHGIKIIREHDDEIVLMDDTDINLYF